MKQKNPRVFRALVFAPSFLAISSSFLGAQGVWDGGGADANWDTALNWDNDIVPATGADVSFNQPFPSGRTISTNGSRTVGTLTLGSVPAAPNNSYTIDHTGVDSTTDVLTINTGVNVTNTAGGTINIGRNNAASTFNLDVGSSLTTWTGTSSGTIQLNADLIGSGQITKDGDLNLRLRGNNSGYSGGWNLLRGNLNLEGFGNGTVQNALGTGAVTFNSTNGTTGNVSVNRGEAFTLANNFINNNSAGAQAALLFQGGALSNAIVTLSGSMTDGTSLSANARVNMQARAGFNAATYGEGRWNVSGNWSGYTGNGVNAVIATSDGTLQIDAQQGLAASNVTYITSDLGTGGSADYTSNTGAAAGAKSSTTKIILNGAFTMANNVRLEGGSGIAANGTGLNANTSKSFGSTNAAGTTATLSGNLAHNSTAGANIFSRDTGATLNVTGNITSNGGGRKLSVNDNYSYSTGVTGANNAIISQAAAGTVVFSGTNTYTSATRVVGGTLLINGSVQSDTVTVESGATLGGTGTINAGVSLSTLQVNGTIAPGVTAGTLTTNKSVSFNMGSALNLEIAGLASADKLAVNNTVDITGGNLAIVLSYAPTIGDFFTVIENDGMEGITGTFSNLADGGMIDADFNSTTYTFQADYAGGTGNDLVLTVVPEPTTALLAVLGSLALFRRRR